MLQFHTFTPVVGQQLEFDADIEKLLQLKIKKKHWHNFVQPNL